MRDPIKEFRNETPRRRVGYLVSLVLLTGAIALWTWGHQLGGNVVLMLGLVNNLLLALKVAPYRLDSSGPPP